MQLHLLRHAHAGDPVGWDGPDSERRLSDKGRAQAGRLGKFLQGVGFRAEPIVTSPKVRCVQTAEIVAGHLGTTFVADDRLAGPLDFAIVEAIIADHGGGERPLLVGHDPDFSELVAALCGAAGVPLRKGALARIEIEGPLQAGSGSLRWLVPPDLLKPG
jgi:phosphohistidine phosphatase